MKFRKKPIAIKKIQWFESVGRFVKHYDFSNKDKICKKCDAIIGNHGFVDTPKGWYIICSNDMIDIDNMSMY